MWVVLLGGGQGTHMLGVCAEDISDTGFSSGFCPGVGGRGALLCLDGGMHNTTSLHTTQIHMSGLPLRQRVGGTHGSPCGLANLMVVPMHVLVVEAWGRGVRATR